MYMAPEPSLIMDISTPGAGGSDDMTMGEGPPIMLDAIVTGIDMVVMGIDIDMVVGFVIVALGAMADWKPGEPEGIGL